MQIFFVTSANVHNGTFCVHSVQWVAMCSMTSDTVPNGTVYTLYSGWQCALWPPGSRLTLEKEAELELMRSKKRQERDYFKKMETGELNKDEEKKPKLLIGKIKDVSQPMVAQHLSFLSAKY